MEPQGFEPRSRPYEWNELAAVLYPCQDHFLRVLPLHQGSVKLICITQINWYRQKESNLYSHVRSVVYYPLYYSDKIGALTPIRTEKTAPFERADFTNLSIRAVAGPAGVEPTTSVSKTEMISISPRTDKNGEPNYPPGRTHWIVSNDQV